MIKVYKLIRYSDIPEFLWPFFDYLFDINDMDTVVAEHYSKNNYKNYIKEIENIQDKKEFEDDLICFLDGFLIESEFFYISQI
jgi:hypothetical protein